MCDMRIQTAIASAQDWCTIAYAAEVLGVSMRTITRYLAAGTLHGHKPRVGSRESSRHKAILSVDEVLALRDALAIVKGEANVR
jgi:hypothetical protein